MDKKILDNVINLRQLVFEVTDACNLKCEYCGYGELYGGYDNRESKNLSLQKAILIIDYLAEKWIDNKQRGFNQKTSISFYGGEPLLNMSLIESVITYVESLPSEVNKRFGFAITTNAMLLDKYMDYLVEKDFSLLISIDGNKEAHSYRVDHAGKNSFDRVFKNVKLLQTKYPDYFDYKVSFMSILHNRSSVAGIYDFLKTEFNKVGMIGEVRALGILPEKVASFNNTYKNKLESLHQAKNYKELADKLWLENPEISGLHNFIKIHSNNYYKDYNDLLYDKTIIPQTTGTCLPFEKKMFVTVNGKILPCEKIDHRFSFGQITDTEVILDISKVAETFIRMLDNIKPKCEVCYRAKSCIQCVYLLDDIENSTPAQCYGYMDKLSFDNYVKWNMAYLAKRPDLYEKLIEEMAI